MKIIAYLNLLPTHVNFDARTRSVALADSARAVELYPDFDRAKSVLDKGEATYEVRAEIPDGSVFEVRGDNDQTEGRGGTYVAGLFDNYPAAYAAAECLGVMGTRGYIKARLAPATVYSTHQE